MVGLKKWAVLRDLLPIRKLQKWAEGTVCGHTPWPGFLRPMNVDRTPGGWPPPQIRQPHPWWELWNNPLKTVLVIWKWFMGMQSYKASVLHSSKCHSPPLFHVTPHHNLMKFRKRRKGRYFPILQTKNLRHRGVKWLIPNSTATDG